MLNSDIQNFKLFRNRRSTKKFIYEDNQCVVFEKKINSKSTVHFLVVPKKAILRLSQASADDEKLLGHLILVAHKIAVQKGCDGSGYHVKVNEDPKSSKVLSLHITCKVLKPVLWPIMPSSKL